MRGLANIGKNALDVRKSVLLQPYSKVILNVDDEKYYEAGNDSGLTLEVECPWGTQAMANDILNRVIGYQYQPYSVTGAIIDPSVEMGDSVQANGVYGGVYQQDATFGHTFYSDFSAPQDEQLDHEYNYKSPTERKIVRQRNWTKAELKILDDAISAEIEERNADSSEFRASISAQSQAITAEVSARTADSKEFRASFSAQSKEISAKVSQTGGKNSSFGWSLLSNEFGLYAGSRKIFTCNSSGVEINGVIKARSGRIGCNADGNGGFEITSNAIRNGKTSYNETTNNGVFIGTTGIGLGKGKFYVDQNGNMVAKNADITGKITATSGSFSGKLEGATGSFKGDISAASGTFTGAIYASKLIFKNTDGSTFTLSGENITNGSIGDGKISGISGSKIGSGINGANINSGSVGSSQIGDGAVGYAKIGSGAVGYDKIGDGAVGSAKISDGAVGSSKIGDSAVTTGKINSGAVTRTKCKSSNDSSDVRHSLDNGDTAISSINSLTAGSVWATTIRARTLYADSLKVEAATNVYETASWRKETINGTTITYLGKRSS